MTGDMRAIVEQGYERGDYAGTYRITESLNEMEEHFFRKLVQGLPRSPRIMDWGCGIGIPYDKYLVDHGCNVTGIDISHKHITQARKNVPSAEFIHGDYSRCAIDRTFDGLISLYAIFHIPKEEHEELIGSMSRLINRGGLILLTLGTWDGYGEDDHWCGARMTWSSLEPDHYKRIISHAGFEILEERFEGGPGDDEHHFWVLARKN